MDRIGCSPGGLWRGVRVWSNGTRFAGQFLGAKPVGAGIRTVGGRTGRCLIENNEVRWLD